MNRTVIIQGSSRSKGDTHKIVEYISLKLDADVIDLNTKVIGHYDYEYKNADDDFITVMTNIIENYDTLIFATPVYWYSMSSIMKAFFDRISDLLRVHKDTGRQLRGKNMAMLSCSNYNDLNTAFSMPFKESAKYLGMNYLGDVHTWIEEDIITDEAKQIIDTYIKHIKKAM
ncbi:FMN reductase [Flavobacteriales bacterium 34_180_T64]|mgnify:CR=1 FL=1|nr:FMN reductase [Flavobacteriales bacterium 34_180_T64]